MSKTANSTLNLYHKCKRLPFGNKIFSLLVSRMAPYFGSIKPIISQLEPNYCECLLRKRRAVENHIGTVHVIAICNGLEMAMGVMAEASIPPHLRWIPKGMTLDYTAKPAAISAVWPRLMPMPGSRGISMSRCSPMTAMISWWSRAVSGSGSRPSRPKTRPRRDHNLKQASTSLIRV